MAKARYTNGAIELLEPLDLREGDMLSVEREPAIPGTSTPGGDDEADDGEGHARLLAWVKEHDESFPPDQLAAMPTDLAENVDHYAYGLPKRDDV